MSETSDKSMHGKTVLVTGASSGIGLWTARGLAAKGAKVVLLCRDGQRGEAARETIRAAVPGADTELLLADLYTMAEVRRAAAEYKQRFTRLDVLVNNAGLIHGKRELTADGFERTFALNHLAPFLLTHELQDLLIKSAPSRVVTVASMAHKFGRLELDNLQSEKSFAEFKSYGTSKLCNILFSNQLARKLAGTGVTSNALHPGSVASNFGVSGGWFLRIGTRIGAPFLTSAEKGARTSIYLASSPEVAQATGGYYAKSKLARTTRFAQSGEDAQALWDASCRLTGVTW
jgi:retinol dehydrogenase 12